MNSSINLFTFSVLLLASLSSAIVYPNVHLESPDGPCRNMRTFPFVSCEPQCETYSLDVHRQCQAKMQFGCLYRRCSAHNFQCGLSPAAAANNQCSDEEVLVQNITLRPNFPVEFDLAVNLPGGSFDVVLLIDASESTRPRLNAVMSELKSFVRQLNGMAHVGVVVYGGEDSFDEKGRQVLSHVEEDVQSALNALDNIPTFPDGVRTTLTALLSISKHGQDLSLRYYRTIVLLIGDTPGREPECSMSADREVTSRELFNWNTGNQVMSVSLGGPGLDSALEPIEPCSSDSGSNEPQAVSAGQASAIAERTNGEVVTSITADSLFEAVDRMRRKPRSGYSFAPGAEIEISKESVEPSGIFDLFGGRVDGCEDRVIVNMTGIPSFVSAPAQITGKVKLDLPRGICQRGAFNCTLRIMDYINRQRIGPYPAFHMTFYKKISVQAC